MDGMKARWKFTFFVHGTPAPGGSKSAFIPRRRDGSIVCRANGAPMVNVTDAGGKANKAWKAAVHLQARSAMQGRAPLTCPLVCEMVHFLARPKAHFRTGTLSPFLRPDAPVYHTQKPDALKFGRATEDGCTGAIWADDCQNVAVKAEKQWCAPGQSAGCQVTIYAL